MLTRNIRLTAAAGAAMAALLAAPAVETQSTGLFVPVNRTHPPSGPLAERTLRSRVVTIDRAQLQRAREGAARPPDRTDPPGAASLRAGTRASAPEPGATLILNLFDDTVFKGLVEWTEPTFSGGYSVSGRLVDDPLGTLALVVNGGRIAGTVRTRGGVYRIRSVDEESLTVSQVEVPPLKCEVEWPHSETDDHRH